MFTVIFRLLDFLAYRWKAVAAFLAPAAIIIAAPMALGGPPTSDDLWKAGAAALGSLFAVYLTPQIPMPKSVKAKRDGPSDDDLSSLEGDQADEPSDDELADLTEVPLGEEADAAQLKSGDHRLGKPIED